MEDFYTRLMALVDETEASAVELIGFLELAKSAILLEIAEEEDSENEA